MLSMESNLYSIVKSCTLRLFRCYINKVLRLPTPGSNATSISFTWYRASLPFNIHYKSPFRLQDELRSGAVNAWIALATTKKLHLSVTDYYSKMCQYADNLAVTGAPLHDDELVVYILAGLDQDYNLVFIAVVARTDPISPSEL
jgi:hypothetical protein